MSMQEEVVKTFNMVKSAGFKVVDVIFEGAMTVQGKGLLDQLDVLSKDRKATGIIRIVYSLTEGDGEQIRVIEIPVGEAMPEIGKDDVEELPSL